MFQAHPSLLTAKLYALDPSRPVTAPRCVSYICRFHVKVRLDVDPFFKGEVVGRSFSGAQRLVVEVFRASWGVGGYEALEGFARVRGVGRARGMCSPAKYFLTGSIF